MNQLKTCFVLLALFFGVFSHGSQHDYVIANDTGSNVRADINLSLLANQSQNSGTTAPATMYAFGLWMDTSGGTPILKMRNAANSAWITLGDASLANLGLLPLTGGTVSGELILTATNDVKIPVGTTAQRNGSPVNGQIRYNSDLKNYEGYHESQFSQFQREVASADYISNVSLSASVASNALTISLKTAAGANASVGDPAIIAFRSATLASGDISLVKVTGSLSTVISSGSTAGHTSAVEGPLYVYAINNAGTVELAWSSRYYDENVLFTTTAEGGAGAADSATVIYSTTARTSVAGRLIGRMLSTQTTAGTWAAVPTNIQVGSAGKIQAVLDVNTRATNNVSTTIATTGDTLIPYLPTTGNVYDSHGGWASSIYTVPTSGKYRINAKIYISDGQVFTAQDLFRLMALVDGSYYVLGSYVAQVSLTHTYGWSLGGSVTLKLTAGSTIRIVSNNAMAASKTTKASGTTDNSVEIERIGN